MCAEPVHNSFCAFQIFVNGCLPNLENAGTENSRRSVYDSFGHLEHGIHIYQEKSEMAILVIHKHFKLLKVRNFKVQHFET